MWIQLGDRLAEQHSSMNAYICTDCMLGEKHKHRLHEFNTTYFLGVKSLLPHIQTQNNKDMKKHKCLSMSLKAN